MSRRFLILLLLALVLHPALAEAQVDDPRDKGDRFLPTGSAILSVSSKNAPVSQTGVWIRRLGGQLTRLWSGEPYDACALPDRTTLVCERWKGRVLRLDPNGKVLFEKKGLKTPVEVELNERGEIVVVLRDPGQVIGLHPKTGAVLWTRGGFTTPFDVVTLDGGGLLVADSGAGRVVELDAKGKVLKQKTGLGFPNTLDRLDDGHTLVTTWSGGEVIELDEGFRVVWKARIPGTVYRAVRRRDGSTLVVEGEAGELHVVDRKGKIRRTERFSPGCVDYEPLPGI